MENNEEILWKGNPKKGFQLVFEDLLIIPFLCFFCFVLYIISDGRLPSLILAGLVLTGIIYIRYIKDIFERQYTEYYITPIKAVIRVHGVETVIYFDTLKKISWKEHPFSYKYGSVIFGEEENIFGNPNEEFSFGSHRGLNLSRDKISIAFIEDYKEVYNLIKEKINKK